MTNRKKKGSTSKSLTIQLAEKVLDLPYSTSKSKNKKPTAEPSKKLQSLLKRVPVVPIAKLQAWSNKVFDLGRLEGFEDMAIGKWIRNAMSEAGYSQRRMEQILPDSAKQGYNRYQDSESEIVSDYQDSVTEDSVTDIPDIEPTETSDAIKAEKDAAKIWEIKPQEYRIEELERYDLKFLRQLVKYLHTRIHELEELIAKK